MRRILLGLMLALPLLVPASAALAASGTALGVDPDASAETGTDRRVLTVGADVFIGDRVVTGDKGLVQIKFSDRTELVVGPRSALVIEDYLLRDDGSAGRLAINALSGTFRFVTGQAAKDRYLIKTPTGTVGVRGTALDLNVVEDHTSLLLIEGAVILCNLAGACVEVDDVCEVGRVDLSEAVLLGLTDSFKGPQRDSMKAMFPFSASQGQLLNAFRVDPAELCLNRRVVPMQQDSGGEKSGSDERYDPKYPR